MYMYMYIKSVTTVNLRLNNHRKDLNTQSSSLQADHHTQLTRQNFNKHATFTLIEQLDDTNMDKEVLKYRLKKREDFWVKKLKTLQLHGFSGELNLTFLHF